MSVNKFKYENCKINKAEIRSNVDGATVNLDAAADLQYSESMFSDTIEVDIGKVGILKNKIVEE